MKLEEYLLFKELCRNKKVFLEYGSGGSTIQLLKGGKKVFSVESNPGFYHYMNGIGLVQRASGHSLTYKLVDLGDTDQWGIPLTTEKEENWSRYYEEAWNDIEAQNEKVDVVFIDGRFRVCCCLYSVLKVVEQGWQDTLFIIHDFWHRKHYHVVLQFLQEHKSAASLGAFTLKKGIDVAEVKNLIEAYAAEKV